MAESPTPESRSGDGEKPQPEGTKPPWYADRRRLLAVLGAAVLVLGGGAYIAYELLKRPGDISNEEVPFVKGKPKKPVVNRTNWPMFGLDRARTRYLPAKGIKPPFKRLWKYGDRPLLEFPPIYARVPGDRRHRLGRLWLVNNNGLAVSLDARNGKVIWQREIAELNATSPAYSKGRIYTVSLEPGQAMALDAKTGKTIWKRPLPGRAESSPVVIRHRMFFGCENGQLFALDTRTGKTLWKQTLAGAIKAAPAYRKGTLYVGDYGGEMSAVEAKTGDLEWQASSQGASFGRVGAFYSTPAVAFGRVYSGNNDSRVYSFDAKTGELAWSQSTGGFVYSGVAVADTKTTPPSVYVGSFDGNVYALDAKSGEVRWTADAGGSVSGSVSVVGNIVYASEFAGTSTSGFRVGSGEKTFAIDTGAYTPTISDGRVIYLTGYSSVTALKPVKRDKGKAGKDGGKGGGGGGNEKASKERGEGSARKRGRGRGTRG